MSQRKLKRLAGAKNPGYRNIGLNGYSNWLWNLRHYSQYSMIEILLVLVNRFSFSCVQWFLPISKKNFDRY